MNGFYAAYLSGRGGQSMVLLAIKEKRIIGVDVGGLKYSGKISEKGDAGFICEIEYTIPRGATLITGPGPVATDVPVKIAFDLPSNFGEGPVIGIATPFGPLNARFNKLSEFDL